MNDDHGGDEDEDYEEFLMAKLITSSSSHRPSSSFIIHANTGTRTAQLSARCTPRSSPWPLRSAWWDAEPAHPPGGAKTTSAQPRDTAVAHLAAYTCASTEEDGRFGVLRLHGVHVLQYNGGGELDSPTGETSSAQTRDIAVSRAAAGTNSGGWRRTLAETRFTRCCCFP